MGLPQHPGPEAHTEAERKNDQPTPPPSAEHAGLITIRWMTETNEEFGFFWSMEILTFEPNERIFDRKTFEDDKTYYSQDTATHLERDDTCASVSPLDTSVGCSHDLMNNV